ncbi:hypothetical protein [Parabacteroides sp.]
MKIKNLLFATMLCGAFGIFTACSNDENPVTHEPENPNEDGVETVISLYSAVDNGIRTRAAVASEDALKNITLFVFKAENNLPVGNCLYSGTTTGINGADIQPVATGGYLLNPIKFKIPADANSDKAKVALIAVANIPADLTGVATYDALKTKLNDAAYVNWGLNYDMAYELTGAQMSSDPYICSIEVGKINAIGCTTSDEKNEALESAKTIFEGATESLLNTDNFNKIELYRIAAEVELRSLTFKNYSPTQTFKHFVLEHIFMMNVPSLVNTFSESPVEKWAGNLNKDFSAYLSSDLKYGNQSIEAFMCGDQVNDANSNFGSGYFRNADIASHTQFLPSMDFQNQGEESITGFQTPPRKGNLRGDQLSSFWTKLLDSEGHDTGKKAYYGQFNNATYYSMNKKESSSTPDVKFMVAPSNYGVSETSKAICLVVRGRYFYEENGNLMGDLDNNSPAKYYTVIVNKDGESVVSDNSVPEHSNEVRRNVKYYIDLTISGPGSDTPWDYDANTFVTPKVTVVPFGTVIQTSEKD